MTAYMMDKFMRSVEMSDAAQQRYIADPPEFVAQWLEGSATPATVSDDHVLDPDERRAFETRDFATLYRLGANPYLLWHWVEATHIHEHSWPELNQLYKDAIAAVRPPGDGAPGTAE